MQKGIFVTGTDTNVGKTWVGERLISALIKQNIKVIPRKPVESGWADKIEDTDAWRLANAAKMTKDIDEVCPFHFQAAISPVRAAQLEKRILKLEDLKQCCLSQVNKNQFLHVEGAGGFYSPLAQDALNADLAKALNLPILLVAEDRVGCINQILLTLNAAKTKNVTIAAIFLNRMMGDSCNLMNNKEDLSRLTEISVTTEISTLVSLLLE